MAILFIKSTLKHDWERVQDLLLILVVFYLCVLVAVLIDLASGVEKARRLGVMRTSFGFRRTIGKVKDYFAVLMLFTVADIVGSVWFSLPFFTAVGTIAMILVEAKSVYENKRKINKGIKHLPEVIAQILRNKDKADELLKLFEEDRNGVPPKTDRTEGRPEKTTYSDNSMDNDLMIRRYENENSD